MTPQEGSIACICGDPACQIPYGLCHCGCKSKTKIAKYNYSAKYGWRRGRPRDCLANWWQQWSISPRCEKCRSYRVKRLNYGDPVVSKAWADEETAEASSPSLSGREEKFALIRRLGWAEYERRKRVAWEEQKRTCSLCHLPLRWDDSSVDHKIPRGIGGGQGMISQDKIAAAHHWCNAARGSKRIGYEEDGG